MAINNFECPRCGKRTRQIELTASEYMAVSMPKGSSQGWKVFASFMGTVNDITGITKVNNMIFGKPWKCCECGVIYVRDASGEIKEYVTG